MSAKLQLSIIRYEAPPQGAVLCWPPTSERDVDLYATADLQMSRSPINDQAFQALLTIVEDSPIHLSLAALMQYVFLTLLLGRQECFLF